MSIIRRESCLKKNRIVILKKYFFSVKEKAEKERIVFVVDEFDLMQKGYKTFLQIFLRNLTSFRKDR